MAAFTSLAGGFLGAFAASMISAQMGSSQGEGSLDSTQSRARATQLPPIQVPHSVYDDNGDKVSTPSRAAQEVVKKPDVAKPAALDWAISYLRAEVRKKRNFGKRKKFRRQAKKLANVVERNEAEEEAKIAAAETKQETDQANSTTQESRSEQSNQHEPATPPPVQILPKGQVEGMHPAQLEALIDQLLKEEKRRKELSIGEPESPSTPSGSLSGLTAEKLSKMSPQQQKALMQQYQTELAQQKAASSKQAAITTAPPRSDPPDAPSKESMASSGPAPPPQASVKPATLSPSQANVATTPSSGTPNASENNNGREAEPSTNTGRGTAAAADTSLNTAATGPALSGNISTPPTSIRSAPLSAEPVTPPPTRPTTPSPPTPSIINAPLTPPVSRPATPVPSTTPGTDD